MDPGPSEARLRLENDSFIDGVHAPTCSRFQLGSPSPAHCWPLSRDRGLKRSGKADLLSGQRAPCSLPSGQPLLLEPLKQARCPHTREDLGRVWRWLQEGRP